MSSNTTLETEDAPTVGIERPRSGRIERLERQVLCDRIEQLERELQRERRQRKQIVEQYERLLDERTEKRVDEDDGLFGRLF